MSIDLYKTLDDSQDAMNEHYRENCARHRRLQALLEALYAPMKSGGTRDQRFCHLLQLLQCSLEFSSKLISEVYVLQEERNLTYFSMKDLEEILFQRHEQRKRKQEKELDL